MEVQLRPVAQADSDQLFAWQVEPGARQYFNNPAAPSRSEHETWFAQRLAKRDPAMWIIEVDDRAVGYVRVDRMNDGDGWRVSILIGQSARKSGYAGAALRRLREHIPYERLQAEIDPANEASRRLFKKAGYVGISDRVMEERGGLAQVDVCYCENEAVWRLALKQGLSPQATVRTTDPSFLMNPPEGAAVVPAERNWTPQKIVALSACAGDLVSALRKKVAGTAFAKYADLLARDAYVWTYRMPWAIALDDLDLVKPRAVVSIDHGSPGQNKRGFAHWGDLLAKNSGLILLSYPASECGGNLAHPRTSPGRWDLLKFYPLSHLEYTLWRRLWQIVPTSLSRGTVYLGPDNPGIRETAIQFARRGYAIVEAMRPHLSGNAVAVPDDLRALIIPALREYLMPWVKGDLQDVLIDLFFDEFSESLGGFDEAMAQWNDIVADWKKGKPVVFLSNIILQTTMMPVRGCLREAGIPLVLFQHGHSRELTKHLEFSRSITEETYSDAFICYDDKANEFVTGNPHRQASAVITAGVPDLYWKQSCIKDSECGDIGYIQTVLPSGVRTVPFTMTWTDLKKDQFESDLLERCLSRLPHSVTVKPYLAASSYGELKSMKVIDKSPNLNLYSKGFDLRYIARNFRVLMTARASSTVGWCLLSGRPFVYLDLPDQYPLWDDVRESLMRSVFFFDMADPGALDELRTFLSRPLEDIEREWALMAAERKRFIDRYLSSGPRGYGKRSFAGIRNYLAGRAA